jgi:hypothetical protein
MTKQQLEKAKEMAKLETIKAVINMKNFLFTQRSV